MGERNSNDLESELTVNHNDVSFQYIPTEMYILKGCSVCTPMVIV